MSAASAHIVYISQPIRFFSRTCDQYSELFNRGQLLTQHVICNRTYDILCMAFFCLFLKCTHAVHLISANKSV